MPYTNPKIDTATELVCVWMWMTVTRTVLLCSMNRMVIREPSVLARSPMHRLQEASPMVFKFLADVL